jgi:hypothetical protein
MIEGGVLWHYTDVHGALGIVQSGVLRFADARFMNDRTERSYGPDVALQALLDYAEVFEGMYVGRDYIPPLLSYLVEHIKARSFRSRLYLCSLSETPNSISQWQRYGAEGQGYCLGFSTAMLKKLKGIRLIKMSYAPTRQKSMVAYRVQQLLKLYGAERQRWSSAMLNQAATTIFDGLEPTLLRIKNPQFADEREWRLIFRDEHPPNAARRVSFVARGAYPKPFISVELKRQGSNENKLPLVKIMCGPKLDHELATLSARHVLDDYGYRDVLIEVSPLRESWR